MKDQIIHYIGELEEYPMMHDLVTRFVRVHYDGALDIEHNVEFLKALLELIDDGKIFYDGVHDAWGLLKEADFAEYPSNNGQEEKK